MYGIKHLITCRCILSQFRALAEPPTHKFIVFSVMNPETDSIVVSYAQCNNCGIVHKITDVCKSTIVKGKEQLSSIPSISDIKLEIPESLSDVLESYNADISIWQHAQFILRAQKWGESIIIQREETDDGVHGKILTFLGSNKFRMESFQESIQ